MDPSKHVQYKWKVCDNGHIAFPLQILIDCCADDNFINANIVTQANILVLELSMPEDALALDGQSS